MSETHPLVQDQETIDRYYRPLLKVIRALHETYPETKREYLSDAEHSDGFSRLRDLVPHIQQYVWTAIHMPEIPSPEGLQERGTQTKEIFAQSRALLTQHAHDPLVRDSEALGLNDALEAALLATYQHFDALAVPRTQNVEPVTTTRLVAAPALRNRAPRA